MTIRILVADDHRVVRDGLREMLRGEKDMSIVAEAASGPEALHEAQCGPVDLMLLDISLPGFSGVRVLQALREAGSQVPVLFFSMHPADQYAAFLRNSGAQGFVGKSANNQEIIGAIRKIVAGELYFPTLRRKGSRSTTGLDAVDSLSAREQAVMAGIVRGNGLNEIAAHLGITAKTVGTYRSRLLAKLGLDNNAELIALASRLGLLP